MAADVEAKREANLKAKDEARKKQVEEIKATKEAKSKERADAKAITDAEAAKKKASLDEVEAKRRALARVRPSPVPVECSVKAEVECLAGLGGATSSGTTTTAGATMPSMTDLWLERHGTTVRCACELDTVRTRC